MQYRELGRTGVKVSEICLGTMTWGKQNSEAEAHAQMDYAVDQQVNFFDTAELYAVPPEKETQGLTEQYIGTWFKKSGQRDKIILASKICGGGLPWIRGGAVPSAHGMRQALDESLTRLQTDFIDLYQIHWPKRANYRFGNHGVDWSKNDYDAERAHIVEILETADALVKEGKIRYLGLSNDTAWGVMTYLSEAERRGLPRIVSIQNEYSPGWRWFDKDLGEVAVAEDVGLLAYSPLIAGAISGKYLNGGRPAGSRWAIDPRVPHRDTPALQAAVRDYMALAEQHGLDVCQMAIAWALTRPFMTSVIIGATSMDQLKMNIAAKEVRLSDEILKAMDMLYQRHPMPY